MVNVGSLWSWKVTSALAAVLLGALAGGVLVFSDSTGNDRGPSGDAGGTGSSVSGPRLRLPSLTHPIPTETPRSSTTTTRGGGAFFPSPGVYFPPDTGPPPEPEPPPTTPGKTCPTTPVPGVTQPC
jgi:hypothetical protein